MVYRADDSAIRDAEDNVADAQYQIRISEIEKSISKLEEARDNETSAIDEMISKLEEYRDAWKDITNEYTWAQEDLIAAQILGAEWETDILNGRLDVLDDFKNQYISIQQAMADAAWQSANEQIKAAQEAAKGVSGTQSSASTISTGNSTTPVGSDSGNSSSNFRNDFLSNFKSKLSQTSAYASGTNNAKKGLNLVGEDGAEVYFDNHDNVAIVTEPTLIPMEGGEVVKNERDTKKLLDPDNLKPVNSVDNIGLADIDGKEAEYTIKINIETNGEIPEIKDVTQSNDGSITLADGTVLRPIQPGDRAWDLQQKFNSYLEKQGGDISSIMAPVNAIQKDMERMVNAINTVNNVNNNRTQNVTIGDIHVTCPGVTSQEIMMQVGVALNRQFSGLALDALQQSKIR